MLERAPWLTPAVLASGKFSLARDRTVSGKFFDGWWVTPRLTDIKAFQRAHFNHLGHALKVDGVLGPQTEWALDFETITAARRAIVHAAQDWIGLTEQPVGSNSDPLGNIQSWLTRCGARPGDPWCASFVSHCIGTVHIAGAQALGKHFPSTNAPFVGDIFWYATDMLHGHCGLITGVGATEVMTIEGNCSNAVRCCLRPRQGLRFSRVLVDTTGTCPGIVPTVLLAPGATR